MPNTCCSAPGCHNCGGHQFPSDSDFEKKQWIIAIRRVGNKQGKKWWPSATNVVCKDHFTEDDYKKTNKAGTVPNPVLFSFLFHKHKEYRVSNENVLQ